MTAEEVYVDPSALAALCLHESHSKSMSVWRARLKGALPVTHHGRTEVKNPVAKSVRLRRLLKDLLLPVDLLVVSRAKYDYWRETPGKVYFEASRKGKVVYEAA